VLIAGGRDKGQDFGTVRDLVRRRVRHAVLIGEGADRIAAAWAGLPLSRAAGLGDAVARALEQARAVHPPAVVLLSPGCSSFDMFRDFEDRGVRFKAEVARLAGEGVTR
jgi:UDP-N-acetylmuramoylalanine--D-glutamate ligase